MHTFREIEEGVKWQVGYWLQQLKGQGTDIQAKTQWVALSEHTTKGDAMNEVNVLNGGNYYVHVENLDALAPAQQQDAA